MTYNNQFSMDKYFQKNYGLPQKPSKYVFGKKSLLVLILFCWIWIPLYIIMTYKTNKEIKEWEEAFEYRRCNWLNEYDKALEKAFKNMNLYDSALKKLGLVEDDPDLQAVKPFYISGNLYDGFWRQDTKGKYRTSRREYTYIVFKQDQILFYRRVLDLLDLERKKETTLEFFYSDITSVNISTQSITPKNAAADSTSNEIKELDVESFILVVPGDKINMAFESNGNVDESIKGMRTLIRERKLKG